MDPLWIEAFKYHRWANRHLLDECSKLSTEQLLFTAPGTYGTVADTWLHLVGAEQRYVKQLGGMAPGISDESEFPGFAALGDQLARGDDDLIKLAGRIGPEDQFVYEYQHSVGSDRLYSGIVLLQALHHGNDHRTHICTVLGHHGLEYGDMDVWAYGDATGNIVKLT